MAVILRIFFYFIPLLLIANLYLGWKLISSFNNLSLFTSADVKWYVIAVLSYLNLFPFILIGLSLCGFKKAAESAQHGNLFWDLFFGYPFWIFLITLAEVLPWLLALDFLKLPLYPYFDKFKTAWMQIEARLILAILALFFVYALVKLIVDTNLIRVSELQFQRQKIPKNLDNTKIVHISDVQLDSRTRPWKVNRYVKRVNKLQPDLVIFTGDLVTSGSKFIDKAAEILGKLKAKYGVYACLGDHDLWSDREKIVKKLGENRIRIFEDRNQFIRLKNEFLFVTFITNTYNSRPNLERLNYLMGQQPRGVLDIVVTHQPTESLVELAAERGYYLFLAGHTHGGQVVIKPFGIPLTPPKFESSFYKGVYNVDQMLASINGGLGLTLVPLRYNAPIEITLLNLLHVPEQAG